MKVNTLWGKEDIIDTKVCMVCKEIKLVKSFGVRAYHKDGTPEIKNTCKSCLSKDAKIVKNHKKTTFKTTDDYVCPFVNIQRNK